MPDKPGHNYSSIEKIYHINDEQRYLLIYVFGAGQALFSVLVFLYLRLYLLTAVCIGGSLLYFVLLLLARRRRFQMLLLGLLGYAFTAELIAACFVDKALGFQDYFYVLAVMSFTFIYDYSDRKSVMRNSVLSSVSILLCYLLCNLLGYYFDPNNNVSNKTILIINSINGLFVLVLLMVVALIFVIKITNLRNQLVEQNNLLLESQRASMMLSQIKPHFMYNTLGAAISMIETDPKSAQHLLLQFTKYMRSNIDSLDCSDLIDFNEELSHIKAYTDIATIRTAGKIKINYEIAVSGFSLPPLTVQPLVENAVKHGIFEGSGAGVVTVATNEDQAHYIITVSDNGIGFDSKLLSGKNGSAGIKNVAFRLQSLCGGRLEVKSAVGSGTSATIFLPKSNAEQP